MANNKKMSRKSKPKYGRIFFSLILMLLIIYFFVQLAVTLFFKEQVTYRVAVDTLNLENEYEAFLMRNEILVDTELTGKVSYVAPEGALVEKNDQIVEIYNDGEAIETLEISERELNQKLIEFDYNTLEYEINTLKSTILIRLENNEFDEIPLLKRDLLLKQERLSKLKEENKFLTNRIASFSKQTIGNGFLSEGEKRSIQAPADGIVTYNLDGFESYLTIDNLYNVNYSELSTMSWSQTSILRESITGQTTLFKIVDLSTYYLLFEISNEEVDTYKNILNVNVHLGNELLTAMVHDVFSDISSAVVVLKMYEPFEGFHNIRKTPVKVVRENYRGLKIDLDSIVNKNGELGVYSVDDHRKLVFVPIKVLAYDDNSAIVYNAQFYDQKKGIVRSIGVDQEIIREAHLFKEGDLIE